MVSSLSPLKHGLLLSLVLIVGGSLAALASEGGLDGWLAVQGVGESSQLIAERNPELLFVPASVTKLVTAVSSLHYLGPDHRLVTELWGEGSQQGPAWNGDLILVGAGDPSWGEHHYEKDPRLPLRELAYQLHRRGIRTVSGNLFFDATRFPGRRYPFSRSGGELALGFAAPTSALAIDENRILLSLAAGPRRGEPAEVRGPEGIEWVNLTTTVPASRRGRGSVELDPQWGSGRIIIRGEYPLGEPPYRIEASVPHPEEWAARALVKALSEAGVELSGHVLSAASRGSAVDGRSLLAQVSSPRWADLLVPVLVDSDNWQAEMLLCAMAAEVVGEGRLDRGLDLETDFLEEVVDVQKNGFDLEDGSGLSPFNLLSPRTVVSLLQHAWSQPWRQDLLAAMARNGDGTLRVWYGLPPVAAKTGTLRHTLALAGILHPESDSPVFFASFLNHRLGSRGPQRREIVDLLRQWEKAAVLPASE